ncbi:hypothetical protein ACOMHN_047531 [Nucella lapillus]
MCFMDRSGPGVSHNRLASGCVSWSAAGRGSVTTDSGPGVSHNRLASGCVSWSAACRGSVTTDSGPGVIHNRQRAGGQSQQTAGRGQSHGCDVIPGVWNAGYSVSENAAE